jgi:hypothetical protein
MFSRTTMLSSTTRPTATVMPLKVMMFKVRPKRRIRAKPIITEVGIETAVTRVARQPSLRRPCAMPLRKRRMMSTANRAPRTPSRATPLIDSSMNDACSKA